MFPKCFQFCSLFAVIYILIFVCRCFCLFHSPLHNVNFMSVLNMLEGLMETSLVWVFSVLFLYYPALVFEDVSSIVVFFSVSPSVRSFVSTSSLINWHTWSIKEALCVCVWVLSVLLLQFSSTGQCVLLGTRARGVISTASTPSWYYLSVFILLFQHLHPPIPDLFI